MLSISVMIVMSYELIILCNGKFVLLNKGNYQIAIKVFAFIII